MGPEAALNVAVFRKPGPGDDRLEAESRRLVEAKSPAPKGPLGYMVLHEPDFDRLWNGVEAGDMLGAAFNVLQFLGPEAQFFIGRTDDFVFGWVGHEEPALGRVLLLQVIPQPHLRRRRGAEQN